MSVSSAELIQGYKHVYLLHPDEDLAALITAIGEVFFQSKLVKIEHKRMINKSRVRRKHQQRELDPYKQRFPSATSVCRFQLCVLLASDRFERDQEGAATLEPAYVPTSDILGVRYVNFLIREAMVRQPHYALAALGGLLYTYEARALQQLSDWLFYEVTLDPHIQHALKHFQHWVHKRFGPLDTQPVAAAAACAVTRTLRALAPWDTEDVQARAPQPFDAWDKSWRRSRFGAEAQEQEARRQCQFDWDWACFHALVNPMWGGIPALVHTVNTLLKGSGMPFDDPRKKLCMPLFRPESPAGPLSPPPAVSTETTILRRIAGYRTALTGRLYAGDLHLLRLAIDGEETRQWQPQQEACSSFSVPPEAAYLTIVAQDDAGDIPLGLIFLADLEEAGHYTLHLADGQQCTIQMTPRATAGERVIQLQWLGQRALSARFRRWRAGLSAWRAYKIRALGEWRATPPVVGIVLRYMRRPLGRWLALSCGVVFACALGLWWYTRTIKPQIPQWSTEAFQAQMQQPASLGAFVSAFSADVPGATPYSVTTLALPAHTWFFRLGTWYAETLALLRSHDMERAASHLARMQQALTVVQAPEELRLALQRLSAGLHTQGWSAQRVLQRLAAFEPQYEAAYASQPAPEALPFFRTGAQLANLTLAAAAKDQQTLRQQPLLQTWRTMLAHQHSLPPEAFADVQARLMQLETLLAQPTLSAQDVQAAYTLLHTMQTILSN